MAQTMRIKNDLAFMEGLRTGAPICYSDFKAGDVTRSYMTSLCPMDALWLKLCKNPPLDAISAISQFLGLVVEGSESG